MPSCRVRGCPRRSRCRPCCRWAQSAATCSSRRAVGPGGFDVGPASGRGLGASDRAGARLSSDSLIVAHLVLPFVVKFGDRLVDGHFEMLDGLEGAAGEEVALEIAPG